MVKLQEEILNEWKKKQKSYGKMEHHLLDFEVISEKFGVIQSENAQLCVQMAESLDTQDSLKDQFGMLLDRFQEYI
jgi:hypothetical protein